MTQILLKIEMNQFLSSFLHTIVQSIEIGLSDFLLKNETEAVSLKSEASFCGKGANGLCSALGLYIAFFLLAPECFMANSGAWIHGEGTTGHTPRASLSYCPID